MGLFGGIKKEVYINKLVQSYRMIYECGDYTAIECLRSNYTADELKIILDYFLKRADDDTVDPANLFDDHPYKESKEYVRAINIKNLGK